MLRSVSTVRLYRNGTISSPTFSTVGEPFSREKLLVPWVVAEPNDKILSAHCNCMAGYGESCSRGITSVGYWCPNKRLDDGHPKVCILGDAKGGTVCSSKENEIYWEEKK